MLNKMAFLENVTDIQIKSCDLSDKCNFLHLKFMHLYDLSSKATRLRNNQKTPFPMYFYKIICRCSQHTNFERDFLN